MHSNTSVLANEVPLFRRARAASAHFQISESTLWHWTKARPGFPQPFKAGAKVTLFDLRAIERYLKSEG